MRLGQFIPKRVVGVLFFWAGTALLALALFMDPLGLGDRGFGERQQILALVGLVMAGAGFAISDKIRASLISALKKHGAPDSTLRLSQILLIAIGFATGCGLIEAAIMAGRRFLFADMPRASQQLIWMASLTNTLILLSIGLLVWLLGFVVRAFRARPLVIFVFAWLVLDTVIHRTRTVERLDRWAVWLLVVGVATVIARQMSARWPAVERRLGRAVASLALIVLLAGSAIFAFRDVRERVVWAGLPDAPMHAPNIIFLLLDTVRSMSLSLYGYARPTTPNLERVAHSSVVFDQAIAPASWTLPSHAAFFTGNDADRHSADWRVPLDDSHATIAELLAKRGYATAGFSANLAYVTNESGLARGFARFEDYVVTPGQVINNSLMLRRLLDRFAPSVVSEGRMWGRKTADDVNRNFNKWLEKRRKDRPFFAFLNYFDAHDIYYAPPPFDTLYGSCDGMLNHVWGMKPKPRVVQAWTNCYDRSITYLDHAIGALLADLEQRRLLDQTILVITSDHGEHLGEHEYLRHGYTLYLPVLAIPLLIRYPASVPSGRRVAQPVTLRDLPSTIVELAGLSGQTRMPGAPLSRFWQSTRSEPTVEPIYSETRRAIRVPRRYPSSTADLKSLMVDGYHYIQSSTGREELYRYNEDPNEVHDLVKTGGATATLTTMRRIIADRADSQADHRKGSKRRAALTPTRAADN